MKFYFPLGLLGLIGVPLLIIIYIIKSKYTEQTIASTYLWELSERFLKKRKPVSKITGIITLILQILAVITVSLLIAHPVFTIRGSANDYFFILDGSASMNMTQGGSTRFDTAKQRINRLIDGSKGGSTYTLVLAGDATNVVFEGVTDKEQAKVYISELKAGWNSTDCASALSLAQEYFDGNRSAEFFLVTDKDYDTSNMTLVNVSEGEGNYAFSEYAYKFEGTGVRITGKVKSFTDKDALTVRADYITDAAQGTSALAASAQVDLDENGEGAFDMLAEASDFSALRLSITDGDALKEDNMVILYDEAKSQQRRILLVNGSDDGAYILSAMQKAGSATVEYKTGEDFEKMQSVSGYGMYVFNCYVPQTLPQNAAIWLINAVDGTGQGAGIRYRGVQKPRDETGPGSYFTAGYALGSSARAKALMKGLIKQKVGVSEYAKYGVPSNYTTVLEIGGDPAVSAGLNENNDRQVVFSFKIGNSNFGMLGDFLVLVKNLMDYSFPSVVDGTVYDCGEILGVNVVPGCRNINVTSPSGSVVTLDTAESDICEVQLKETGTYKISVRLDGVEEETELYVFACVPMAESGNPESVAAMALAGEKEYNYSDGYYDKLLAFFIIIALLLLADWGVYCYEQYQLR